MNLKVFLLLFSFFDLVYAKYEVLKIGSIDTFYNDKITKSQLNSMVKNIEKNLESTLGYNIFDIKNNGKPINLVYMPPSKSKLTINDLTRKLTKEKAAIEKLQEYFLSKEDRIVQGREKLKNESESLNAKIRELNSYIEQMNAKKISSKYEYEKIKTYINTKKKDISYLKNSYDQKRIKFNDLLSAYNQKLSLYNSKIRSFNRNQRKLEVLARSAKELKGAAIGYKKITFKTFEQNGERVQKKQEENYMEKVEIYGFESLAELEVILAHEIAHMVGVGHVNVSGALMNPVLQKGQIGNLKLTSADIKAFKEGF